MTEPLVFDGHPLSLGEIAEVTRQRRPVHLGDGARGRLDEIRRGLERRLDGDEALYGINTGFGSLSRVRVEAGGLAEMQHNLIRSHAAGVGDPLPDEVVVATMLLLAASLSRGCSGVRPMVVDQIVTLINRRMVPVVPCRGSVGASGDLAPLAHIALALIGEGKVRYAGVAEPTGRIFVACGIEPLRLAAKEGLALINGTHLMAAQASLGLLEIERLLDAALLGAAMSIDGCRATDSFLDARLHDARNQPGQSLVAARLRQALVGSTILPSHRIDDPRVQDPYCLRATPQVVGAAFDALEYVRQVVDRELGAVTDNPLVFPRHADGSEGSGRDESVDVVSGGNFHGMPLAIAMDLARIALCHVAGIAERRVNWVLSAADPQNPVSSFLSPHPGLHSGLMIAQYTAAACCNEMQTIAHPASVHNVTTSAGIEDYNSFGATSALLFRHSIDLLRTVIAIELLVMAEAMEHHRPLRSGTAVESTIERIRTVVPKLERDRPPSPDIAAIERLIRTIDFRESAASEVG